MVSTHKLGFAKKLPVAAIGVAAALGLMIAPLAPAQTLAPEWEKAAGGKMSFDSASIKINKAGYPPVGPPPHSNFPMGSDDAYSPNGGLFAATNWPVISFMGFAYKLTPYEMLSLGQQLPKWAHGSTADHFDIQARTEAEPTKDQMRLMMQSLLADRFKLAVHFEVRHGPVFALVLSRPGKLGPQLKPHSANLPCTVVMPHAATGPPATQQANAAAVTPFCGMLTAELVAGHIRDSTRSMSMQQIGDSVFGMGSLDRPVLDRTGLSGNFDFTIEFTPETPTGPPGGLRASRPDFQPDQTGPTFLEALKEQLGLKLDSQTGFVDVLVIDHIEEPSAN